MFENTKDKNYCAVHAGLRLEFRISDEILERRILNPDGTTIDSAVSEWKTASPNFVNSMAIAIPGLKTWLTKNEYFSLRR